jgi:anti-anti-sigma factor
MTTLNTCYTDVSLQPMTQQATSPTEHIPCLEVGSSLTAQDAPAVAAWLEQTAQEAPNHIVVSLVDVTSIDGVGLQTLMQGLQRVIDAAVPPRQNAPGE